MSKAQIRILESYVKLQQDIAGFHVMLVAARLGVLSALESGQKTAVEIASLLKLNPERTEWLMLALSETEICERHGDDYALTQAGRMLPNLGTLGSEHWRELENFVTDKSVPASPALSIAPDDAYLSSMAPWMQTPAAMDVAEILDVGRIRNSLHILEVGGGSAVFGSAIAHRDPTCRVVVLEHPANIEQASKTVNSIGLEERFQIRAIEDNEPQAFPQETFDLVIAVGQMHGTPSEQGPALLKRLASCVKPGGELALVDWFPGQEPGMRTLAFYQLELALRRTSQSFHSPQMIRDWVRQAGLSDIQYSHLPSPPNIWGLLLAKAHKEL